VRRSLAVVCFSVLLASCSRTPRTGVAIDRDFRPYVPPNVRALASVQIDKLKTTDLYKRHAKAFDLPEVDAISERIGLDPRRDLTSLLAAWDGKQPVFLMKGKFSPDQLKQRLETLGAKSVEYKSHSLLSSGRDALAVVDSGLTISGPADAVRATLDQKTNGDSGISEELEPQLKNVLKEAQIWEISRGGIPLSAFPARADVQSMLGNFAGAISETTIGIHCDSGVQFQADIKCVSKAGAQRVHDALRGLVGLARLSTDASDLDLLRLWDAVNVDQDQDVIHVRADLSASLTEKLFGYLPKVKKRARGAMQPF
jgi:hypothetical protein